MLKLLNLLAAYWHARHTTFNARAGLKKYQMARLHAHMDWLSRKSPYFKRFGAPDRTAKDARALLQRYPLMNKETMMANFDQMVTADLQIVQIMALAGQAESTRDFQATLNGHTVGLSSGTSAMRGAFVVSDREKAKWAGTILAKLLPAGLFAGERVALFLRADSGLYQAVKTPWLTFRFFDLVSNFPERVRELEAYQPTILVAPAQVLRQLALRVTQEGLSLRPKKVVSVAEVLEPADRQLLRAAFGEVIHEVYQATEGFLASSCEHGTLHLNEEYVHFEKEWVDKEQTRFVPVITDFTRRTQPIVRYRLNDVLVVKPGLCACGRVTQTIEAIEGRCDDMLILRTWSGAAVPVFADAVSRVLAQALPHQADYRLVQETGNVLQLSADTTQGELVRARDHLVAKFTEMGAVTDVLTWELSTTLPPFNPMVKRRRIIRNPGIV